MSTLTGSLQELDKQAAIAAEALQKMTTAAELGRDLPRLEEAIWTFVRPYWHTLTIADRLVDSGADRPEIEALHSPLLRLEHMADNILATARERGYFEKIDTAAPLLSLESANERIKDCMVALESMLDPQVDDIMAAALEEHQRGETVPLDSVN
jgi:hypothetical protein